ncbi:hypothetical protein J437_LFUL007771 [Ladona fulva]|uniref:Netrin receptor UNC5A-D-like N-terminal domain-containing protein n=1 Tax=Ladona fulva TaxID=123851 RepID=A0A8K0NWB5_LADFU|nr:hypothetical protein J437_LFUL007771 [Ladona fulva]
MFLSFASAAAGDESAEGPELPLTMGSDLHEGHEDLQPLKMKEGGGEQVKKGTEGEDAGAVDQDADLEEEGGLLLPHHNRDHHHLVHRRQHQLPQGPQSQQAEFLEEPEDAYVVRGKPATLTCRAANTLRVIFRCNGEALRERQVAYSSLVDPESGRRVAEARASITRNDVEEFFGESGFRCDCLATSPRGSIRSRSALVDVACEY